MLLTAQGAAAYWQQEIKKKIASLGRLPTLAVLLVGEDPASLVYVGRKQKKCSEHQIRNILIHKPASISQKDLLSELAKLNEDPSIDAILIQLPLPSHINSFAIVEAINPKKDVDCLHPYNVGKLALGCQTFIPCTPGGIQLLLQHAHLSFAQKEVLILGRSQLVGKPLSLLLSQKGVDATVTLAHSRSKHLQDLCRRAEILVAAIGVPKFVKKEMVQEGAIVIDVGITRTNSGLVGDVDFDEVAPKCSYITPVPGGVGPMTITMLLLNVLSACQ